MSTAERSVRIDRKGREGQPVVVIDNYLADPAPLLALVHNAQFELLSPYYPGIRAALPREHYGPLLQPLTDILRQVFEFGTRARVDECNFSLATTAPEQLAPIQRLPHYDGLEEGKIAVLLYLCPPNFRGTSFYRHRRTGYETVTAPRFETYRASLEDDIREFGLPPARYIDGDDARFERIESYHATFNRLLIYRGVNLHCADLANDAPLPADPQTGRLTLNAFLTSA